MSSALIPRFLSPISRCEVELFNLLYEASTFLLKIFAVYYNLYICILIYSLLKFSPAHIRNRLCYIENFFATKHCKLNDYDHYLWKFSWAAIADELRPMCPTTEGMLLQ